jgi:hypothetical protein
MLALAASPGQATANWEYTVWGMTPEDVAAASGGKVRVLAAARPDHAASPGPESMAEGRFALGPFPMTVKFGFDQDRRLTMVTLTFAEQQRPDQLKAWLNQNYGKPRTMPAADEDMGSWTWITPDKDVIELVIDDDNPAILSQHPNDPR